MNFVPWVRQCVNVRFCAILPYFLSYSISSHLLGAIHKVRPRSRGGEVMKKQVIADKEGGGYRPLRMSLFYPDLNRNIAVSKLHIYLPVVAFLVVSTYFT